MKEVQSYFYIPTSACPSPKTREKELKGTQKQGDQIGRIFAYWVIANFGQFL
jgi:hypothetical protein